MIYITISDVRSKPIDEKILKAGWSDADVERVIDEAESYVEGYLLRLGYVRSQLQKSKLVKSLCVLYSRYAILRDIYTLQAPSTSAGEEYHKWKENVDDILEKISKNEIVLIDNNGDVINIMDKSLIKTTTDDVPRAVTMGNDYEWGIDSNYTKEDITQKAK